VGRQRRQQRDLELSVHGWRKAGFWEEVRDEISVETMRWNDFASFMGPADASGEPDPEFTVELREHLRDLVRRLYTS